MSIETLSDEMKDLLERWPMGESFDLPRASTCIVAGAYSGRVMELLDEMYSPERIVGFEPQFWAFEQAWQRLRNRPNCLVVPWGIGANERGVFPMGEYGTDGCSFVNTGSESREQGTGLLVDARDAFRLLRLEAVDLAVFNMEGYEYRLLPFLIELGAHRAFDRFAVQFHTAFGDPQTYMKICVALSASHDLVIDDFPRWVYWRRK